MSVFQLAAGALGRGRPAAASSSIVLARSMFTARAHDPAKPYWLKVGLALGTTVGLWVLLIKQHNDDVAEYKRRNGLQ
ncbi:NADH dehydrogenase [ubiquinone] 1 subunit C1, mitochondrial [Pseudophryne corroboree]|uniref:NADH dehydrogenase [ubiquinone] 1 subunit C1, mitochondrial n=1 Tax=Pseudophryne corroboree TaxID=495146 RepID=UPI003081DF17